MNSKDKQAKMILSYGFQGVGRITEPIITDPMGSYTGRPIDQNEIPTQDADDL